MRKTIFFSLFLGLACIFPSRAMAQTVEFRILIDIDDDPGTGCTVSTVDGPVTGVDQILITTVDQTTQMVSGVSLSTCSSGVFGPPVPISAGGWPIGQGLGLAGSDVVETYYPTDMLNPPNGQIRVALVANDQLMSEDALLDNQGEPLWIRLFVPVPTLSSILLLVFILALFGFGLYFLRKYPEQRGALVLLLCLGGLLFVGFSSAISLDGDPSDWNVAPLAMDPSGDNGSAPDVLAFFGCVDGIYPRPQTVFFRIDAVLNQPPTANPSSLSLLEDDPATTIALSGSDPEGQSLTFSIVNPPANGSLSAITPTGPTSADIDYTPNPDFFGNDSFTFIVNDGLANSAPATVSLTIDPINDAPSFAAGPDLTIDKDTGPQTAPNWATNIAAGPPNESGQVLTFNIVNNSNPGLFSASGQPAVASNGTLTFENEPDVNGFADIELQLMDDGGTANGGVDVSPSQTFRITFNAVNDCPVAQNDAVMTDEDTPLAGDVLIDNGSGADSDIDGPGLLLVTAVNGNAAAVGVATMLPSGALLTQNANGTFNYDPNGAFDALAPGETDTDSWVYTLDDSSGLCAETATVTVTISGVNDCPTAVADALSTDEDTPTSGNVLANNGSGPDSDPESDPLTVVAVEGMPANVGVQITLTSGALLTVNSDGSFSYDPNGQFEALGNGDSANDSFTYAIDDGSMTCSEVATATVTINGVNDCPTAQPDAVVTDEDTALNGDVLADNGSGPDSDPESDPLVVSAVNGNPANVGVQITLASGALLTVNANGTFAYDPNGQFESLGPGDTDSDSFTYTIDDGSGCSGLAQLTETVAITINGLNDCPVAVDDSFSTDEDTPIMGDVLVANPTTADSDPDGGTLAVVAVQGMPANVGMLVTLPSGAQVTVNANGSFSYDPNGAFESLGTGDMGMDSFTYSIDDGSMACSEQATVTVALNGINDCPVAVNDAVSTDEATVLNGDLLAANPTTPDSDPEGNPISVTAVNGNAGNVGMQIALGSGLLTVNANGTFSFDPNGAYETLGAGDSAMESFTYTIDDGSGCAETATVNLTINGVNDCPVAVDDTFSTDEDMVLNGDVLAANPTTTDSDIESDPLNVTAVNGNAANVGMMFALPSGAQLTVNANGTFSYNPMGAFSLPGGSMTTDSFTYTIDDGSMACAEIATVTITVIGVND
ncbi:MAG: tandem-95 repeat protein, partial [Acidobacteria bacterium]|nr:tandem-95 repeat protein [Acidobacteriota bacterium]